MFRLSIGVKCTLVLVFNNEDLSKKEKKNPAL